MILYPFRQLLWRFLTGMLAIFCNFCLFAKNDRSVYMGINYPSVIVQVDDEGTEGSNTESHQVIFTPKIPTILVLGASSGLFSISYSQDVDTGEESLDYTNYGFRFMKSWVGIDASFSEFTRFRVEESTGFDGEMSEEELRRPSMETTFIGANAYIFPLSLGYSYEAAFDPAVEKNTGLGVGLIASWNSLAIKTRHGLLPEVWKDAFGGDGHFVRGELSGSNIQGVVSLILALGPLYASALFAVGPGNHEFSYDTEQSSRSGSGTKHKLNQMAAIGYCGESFFMGLSVSEEAPDYELKFMTLGATRQEANFVMGQKF